MARGRLSAPDTVRRFVSESSDDDVVEKQRKSGRRDKTESVIDDKYLVAIFVCRSSLPAPLYTPLPQLARLVGSSGTSQQEHVKLVELPRGAETYLSRALNMPRVGIVGVVDCPAAKVLLEYVSEHVPA